MENANYAYKLTITITTTLWYKQIESATYAFFGNDIFRRGGSVVKKPISGDFYKLKHRVMC